MCTTMKSSFIIGLLTLVRFSRSIPVVAGHENIVTKSTTEASKSDRVLNFAFKDAIVNINFRGAPIHGQNLDGRKDIIVELAKKYECTQDLPTVTETNDERLEINVNYVCDRGQGDKDASRFVYMILVIVACVALIIFARMARRASSVEGELRWRLWRVPCRRTLNFNATRLPAAHDMDSSKGSIYGERTISDKLSKAMTIPILIGM